MHPNKFKMRYTRQQQLTVVETLKTICWQLDICSQSILLALAEEPAAAYKVNIIDRQSLS